MQTVVTSPRLSYSLRLFITTLTLCAVGLLFVFEASAIEGMQTFDNQYHFVTQHAIGLGVGLLALLIGYCLPTQLLNKTAPLWYLLSVILLTLVFIPGIGLHLNGASRWISIGGFLFQPTEFVKLGVIIFYSHWLSKHQRFAPFLFLTGLVCGLILLQPNLSSTILIGTIACSLYFVAGGNMWHLVKLACIAIPFVILAIFGSEYRMRRLTTFLNPDSDPLGASFHIRQITLALGRGGFFGQGIGESQQKFAYIPEPSTDSIFAIIAEEVGFLGSLTLIVLFGLFLWHGYQIAVNTKEAGFARLLAFGIITWIGLQIILNLSAIVGLIPLTGMPLPFISYGRSSLIMILFATGVLMRIGKKS